MSTQSDYAGIEVGDYVKLGPSAKEKHYVMTVWPDTVRVRQASTGKVRDVKRSRCIVIFRTH
jgi:hypothetical protein